MRCSTPAPQSGQKRSVSGRSSRTGPPSLTSPPSRIPERRPAEGLFNERPATLAGRSTEHGSIGRNGMPEGGMIQGTPG